MSDEIAKGMPLEQVEQQFAVLISDLHLMYRKYFNRKMRDIKLTAAQWQVLSCLRRNENITQTEIAELMAIGKSPVGKMLDSLEASGWIKRKTSEHDRRIKNIELTGKLGSIDVGLVAVLSEMNTVTETGLDDETVEQVRLGLITMRENLTKALLNP